MQWTHRFISESVSYCRHIVMSIIIRVAVAIIIIYDHPLHVAMVNKSTHPHKV